MPTFWKNDIQAGAYGFGQHQSNYFNNVFTDCGTSCQNFPPSTAAVTGGLEETFVSDKFHATPWLTLIAGFRQSHFTADIVENDVDPRFGIAVKSPAAELGVPGILRRILSAAAAADGNRAAARIWPTARILHSLRCTASATRNIRSA